jgi:zinc transporter
MATAGITVNTTNPVPLDRGYLFTKDGIGEQIDAAKAIEWLKRDETPPAEFVWLHFHDIPSALEGWPVQLAEVPAAFGDTVREGYRSTRIMRAHKHFIAVLNDVDYDTTRKRRLKVATLWVSADARCLLSVRTVALRSVEELRREVQAGHPFHSPMALLIRLLQQQAEVMIGIGRSALQRANDAEDALFTGKLPKGSRLAAIRRDLVRLRRLLTPEPAALFRLVSRPPDWLREEDAQSLHQCAEQFSLELRDTSALEEHIRLLQAEIDSKVVEHTNRSVLILTSVTVIALPITLISGVFGMNIGGLPLSSNAHGFWLVLPIAVLLTCVATWLIARLTRD